MSHPRAISLRFAIIRDMSRCALLVLCVVAACSKSAGNQDKVSSPPSTPSSPPAAPGGGGDVVAVPTGAAPMGGPKGGPKGDSAAPAAPMAPAAPDDRFKLQPQEGKLAIEPPADAKAGAEAVAMITVTPGKGYHVNTEYPTKLTLTAPDGVTLAKDKFIAGGKDKAKGDTDAFEEQRLAIAVKLTPSASGSYTINGNFKFAVCDADQCLVKQEAIAIAVAAK
jgi:hypothetical protein